MVAEIFDSLLEPVFVTDSSGLIRYCNPPVEVMFETPARKILGKKKIDELFPRLAELFVQGGLSGVRDPTPYREMDFSIAGRAGRVQISLQPFGPDGWLFFTRDVTLEETLQKKYQTQLEEKQFVIEALQEAQAELKSYSINLEDMVTERTAEIKSLNQTLAGLLDSLGQGFLVFDSSGKCLPVFSKSCLTILEIDPAEKWIWEVLRILPQNVESFQKWMVTIFNEMLPFSDLAPLGPSMFPHSESRNISLAYNPIRGEKAQIAAVVVVATDITELLEAQRTAETEKSNAKSILLVLNHKREVRRFLTEGRQLVIDILSETKKSPLQFGKIFRWIHTLKGGASSFSCGQLVNACHEAESCLDMLRLAAVPGEIAELQLEAQRVAERFGEFESNCVALLDSDNSHGEFSDLQKLRALVSKVAEFSLGESQKSEIVMGLMGVPLETCLAHLVDLLTVLSEREGKRVAPLRLHGAEIQVIPAYYSGLLGSLVHAIRNSLDHGLELPEIRTAQGKPEMGLIEIFASLVGDRLLIEIVDDGGGINTFGLRQKLGRKGESIENLSDEEVHQRIFDFDSSTREKITDLSGRGVGMNAIAHEVHALGGSVHVHSQANVGTKVSIDVPYCSNFRAVLEFLNRVPDATESNEPRQRAKAA